MNIHITLVTYALSIKPLWDAVVEGIPDVKWHVFNHGTSADIRTECENIRGADPDFYFYSYTQNRGLSRSWNEGLLISQAMDADAMIIVNDDVMASADDIIKLATTAATHREAGVIVCEGYNKRMVEHQILGHAVFAINPIAVHRVGYFDENFFPIYFEDTDYSRRCHLAGVTYHNAGPTGMVHTGSDTIATDNVLKVQNDTTFAKNWEYYCRKWGGPPGNEQYSVPFDDIECSYQITANIRHNPFGIHDRTDREIVRI